MPAEGKVSMLWQIIFVVCIPIAGIWAFYRIKKLQKMLLYLVVPEIILVGLVLGVIFWAAIDGSEGLTDFDEPGYEYEDPLVAGVTITASIVGFGITVLAIYLIYKWTEEWNKQFDTFSN